ncbi:MAG: winged helix-turn-helix transcriptional regulator [Ruminococcus sp.]|nr:winged helix-turn-helix transcriptional regulator [Ruminococcus sp.]
MENNEIKIITDGITRIGYLYEKWAKEHNINSYIMDILYAIKIMGITKQKEIVENYGMPKQTVNTAITELQRKEYIKLIQDENDKRSKIIELTPEGENYADLILSPLVDCEKRVLGLIEKENIDIWIKTMNQYADLFEKEMKRYKSGGF